MKMPAQLQEKYLQRFDELIDEGRHIKSTLKEISGRPSVGFVAGIRHQSPPTYQGDAQCFLIWRTRCVTLLSQVIGKDSPHLPAANRFAIIQIQKTTLEWAVSTLIALKKDFDCGFLTDITTFLTVSFQNFTLKREERAMHLQLNRSNLRTG